MEIRNKSATFEYFIEEKFDAGMVLTGTEVKALRDGSASFNDSYCLMDRGELYIKGLHISHYSFGGFANHVPTRDRKLLLKKRELVRLTQKLKELTVNI
ncbi:MAG: SsrA-binding protein [Chitinophagaceae bacterium]